MGLSLLLRDRLGVCEVVEADSFDAALDRLADTPDVALAPFDLSMRGKRGKRAGGCGQWTEWT